MDNFEDLFDNEDEERPALFEIEEIENICKTHIEEGHDPYTEVEVEKIIRWIEEIRIGEVLLNLVVDGKIDVIFDYEKIDKMDEDGLLFGLTKKMTMEIENKDTVEVDSFLDDLKLSNDGDKE